eukprot:7133291-Pyramimonas_sp.AAC.1
MSKIISCETTSKNVKSLCGVLNAVDGMWKSYATLVATAPNVEAVADACDMEAVAKLARACVGKVAARTKSLEIAKPIFDYFECAAEFKAFEGTFGIAKKFVQDLSTAVAEKM